MNASIQATRLAIAIQNIEAQVRRLGGEVSLPSGRGDVATKQVLTLERIAEALGKIEGVAPAPMVKGKGKGKADDGAE
jgi:hypothetical protein